MADTIKNGSFEVTSFKVGNADCKIYLGDTLLYPHSTPPTVKNYLKTVARGSGTFTFYGISETTANTVYYSMDSGTSWTQLVQRENTPTVNSGDVIMWKCTSPVMNSQGMGRFSASTNFDVEGNVMSMQFGDDFEDKVDLTGKDMAFCTLFSGCTNLISAENLELPATTLCRKCYYAMFQYCLNLTKVPKALPAKNLANECYQVMFYNTAITSLPTNYLPATTLAERCYWGMFQQCSGLTAVNFSIPSTDGGTPTLAASACTNMFNRCSSLVTPPTLPATALTVSCYYNFFYQNLSLKESPVLPAPTLVDSCYRQMFNGSSKLNKVTCLATSGINTNNSTNAWLTNTASSGTFYRATNVSWPSGNNGRKSWTLVNYSG